MTLDQKLSMLIGVEWNPNNDYIGKVNGIDSLGIPSINLQDGPQGVRNDGQPGTSTQWPSLLTMGASFDKDLVYEYGQAMGSEFYLKGANVQLGPAVNVNRVPRNGRNFEYISGEDPKLGSVLAAAVTQGIQSKGVIANLKHFAFNNQETNRKFSNSIVDERTMWEIYYPPFQAVVDAGVLSAMCSYNLINGEHACQSQTIKNDLKEKMGFKGWIMSDWWSQSETIKGMNNGLDQQMPGSTTYGPLYFTNCQLKEALNNNQITQDRIDQAVLNIITPMYQMGYFDENKCTTCHLQNNVTSVESQQKARRFSRESTVLLKNKNNILPLKQKINIVVFGKNAGNSVLSGSLGSGGVTGGWVSVPIDAIYERFQYSKVLYSEQYDEILAQWSDVAVVFGATTSSEGFDRDNLNLDDNVDQIIEQVAIIQPNTIAVVSTPGSILMPWADKVAGILINIMPGQEVGHAIADILSGDYNPSARLPITIMNEDNEIGFTQSQWPGDGYDVHYSEKLEVGYRWFNSNNKEPLFRFGSGLSYTQFEYNDLNINRREGKIIISMNVTNVGQLEGAEVSQVYVDYPKSAGEPPQQLKGFEKNFFKVGQSQIIIVTLIDRDLSIWNVDKHDWQLFLGTFKVCVGGSTYNLNNCQNLEVLPNKITQ